MNSVVLLPLVFQVLSSAAPAQSGAAFDTWGTYDVAMGYEWVAASRVLTAKGLVRSTGVHDRLRRGLEWQLRGSSADHGLKEGEVAASDEWCASPPPVSGSYVQTEQDGRFISALLLAEVAVTATLAEAIPGFFPSGNPGVLFVLSDVAPLHGRSVVPAYALVPADRLVMRGRVFCAVTPQEKVDVNPELGDRVVLLGEWRDHGTVRTGHPWTTRLGHVALVRDDRETLQWDFFPDFTNPPESLSQLHRRVAQAVSGGLIDLAARFAVQEHGSPERVEFVERLGGYEANGCRVEEIVENSDQGWSPARIVCPGKKVPEH